jgi:hypothetical protein
MVPSVREKEKRPKAKRHPISRTFRLGLLFPRCSTTTYQYHSVQTIQQLRSQMRNPRYSPFVFIQLTHVYIYYMNGVIMCQYPNNINLFGSFCAFFAFCTLYSVFIYPFCNSDIVEMLQKGYAIFSAAPNQIPKVGRC